jgi:hypothetical protein
MPAFVGRGYYKKSHKNLRQDSRSRCRDVNPGLPDYDRSTVQSTATFGFTDEPVAINGVASYQ